MCYTPARDDPEDRPWAVEKAARSHWRSDLAEESPRDRLHDHGAGLHSGWNDLMAVRSYADTSVFGGVFDEEFAEPSKEFFREVCEDRFTLVTSAVVQAELEPAPEEVRKFFEEILGVAEVTEVTDEALALRDAYLQAKIVTAKYTDDALHVALASVSNCRVIVSWNFRHVVHFEKIPKYNAVNVLHGYAALGIYSPTEVIRYEEQ